MDEFVTAAHQRQAGAFSEAYQTLFEFRRRCLGISFMFDRWWDNLEELFTQAHLNREVDRNDGERIYDDLVSVIWDIYRRAPPSGTGKVAYVSFARSLFEFSMDRYPIKQTRPVVITTNYDVFLDLALTLNRGDQDSVRHQCAVGYSGVGVPESKYFVDLLDGRGCAPTEEGKTVYHPIEIIKLHGSVNWIRDQVGTNGWQCECDFVPERNPKGEDLPVLTMQTDEWGMGGRSPLIVPPLLGKTASDKVIGIQWQRAVQALSNADMVIVVGYSFPNTDLFMTRLLAQGLMDNDALRGIHIVNPDAEDSVWRDRVGGVFSARWRERNVFFYSSRFSNMPGVLSKQTLGARKPVGLRFVRE